MPQSDDQPIRRFAHFFRAYYVGLALLTAAVPVVISAWDLVPLYANTKNFLTLVTSVGSYLLVGFIFSQRAAIGRLYFPRGGKGRAAYRRDIIMSGLFARLPAVLLVFALFSFFMYFHLLNRSIERVGYRYAEVVSSNGASRETRVCDTRQLSAGQQRTVAAQFAAFGKIANVTVYCENRATAGEDQESVISYSIGFPDQEVVQTILSSTPSTSIPYSVLTSIFFLAAFLSSTSAFILMGLKEYIQEDLGIKDEDLIYYPVGATVVKRFDLTDAPGLYGEVEFSPVDPTLTPRVTGPFCTWHQLKPTPKDFDENGKPQAWIHVSKKDARQLRSRAPLRRSYGKASYKRFWRKQLTK